MKLYKYKKGTLCIGSTTNIRTRMYRVAFVFCIEVHTLKSLRPFFLQLCFTFTNVSYFVESYLRKGVVYIHHSIGLPLSKGRGGMEIFFIKGAVINLHLKFPLLTHIWLAKESASFKKCGFFLESPRFGQSCGK